MPVSLSTPQVASPHSPVDTELSSIVSGWGHAVKPLRLRAPGTSTMEVPKLANNSSEELWKYGEWKCGRRLHRRRSR